MIQFLTLFGIQSSKTSMTFSMKNMVPQSSFHSSWWSLITNLKFLPSNLNLTNNNSLRKDFHCKCPTSTFKSSNAKSLCWVSETLYHPDSCQWGRRSSSLIWNHFCLQPKQTPSRTSLQSQEMEDQIQTWELLFNSKLKCQVTLHSVHEWHVMRMINCFSLACHNHTLAHLLSNLVMSSLKWWNQTKRKSKT